MKVKIVSIMLLLAVVFSLAGFASPVSAAAYGTSMLTSITYMNISAKEAVITLNFFAEGATDVTQTYPVSNLAGGAAASLGVGSVFPNTFKGSAVMSSSQPLVATMVQVPNSTTVKNRPLSNASAAGSTTVLLATVLKGNANSIFSIQNAGSQTANNVSVQFIPATAGTAYTATFGSLAPGASKYFDMGAVSNVGTSFSGSVRVTADQPVVVSNIEASTTNDAIYAFEGTSETALTVYMPSAMCNYGKAGAQTTSYYAVQNSAQAGQATSVTVDFTGTVNGTPYTKSFDYGSLDGGKKVSVSGCGISSANGNPTNFIGSAVVHSSAQPLAAMAKIVGTAPYATAHLGATTGYARLAAPYVRFSNKFYSYTNATSVQRAYIAVQNIGADLPAGTVTVKFVGPDGAVQGSYTYQGALAQGAKFSVNPETAGLPEFGYATDPSTGKPKSYGGGAIIEGPNGSQLAAVVRISTSTAAGEVAEDYNAMNAVVPAQ